MARKDVAKSMTEDEMYNALPESCKNPVMKEICGMFIESRNELGFPFTERAFKIVINKYEWTAEMLAASLLCAMERGWRGVFLPDGKIYSEYAESYKRMMFKSLTNKENEVKEANTKVSENGIQYISNDRRIENGKLMVFDEGFWHPQWKVKPTQIYLRFEWSRMSQEQKLSAMKQYEV